MRKLYSIWLFLFCTVLAFNVSAQTPSVTQNYVIETKVKTAGKNSIFVLAGLPVDSVNKVIQYKDGLGRPIQTIHWQASPGKKDIVMPDVYDAFGRQETSYLPYAEQTSNNGVFQTSALTNQSNYYGTGSWDADVVRTTSAFSKTVFEASPLNRVLESGSPSTPWQPAASRTTTGRTQVAVYTTNNSTTAYTTTGFAARLFDAAAVTTVGNEHMRTLSSSAMYGAGQLILTIVKDENWTAADGKAGTLEEYKDNLGRVILKRTFNKTGTAAIETYSTYYVYDDMGNLSFVLTPAANPDAGGISQATLDDYCYQYRYDEKRRLIQKKLPGKGWEEIIYNVLDQVVFTQDAVQAAASSPGPYRSYIKYDALGRVIILGVEKGHTDTRATVQQVVNNLPNNWETRSTILADHGYTNVSAPYNTSTIEPEVVNYYDDYDIPGIPNNQSANFSNRTAGMLTAIKVKILGTTDKFLWTVNYYNDNGELVKIYKQHYKNSVVNASNYDEVANTYNFAGELTASVRRHYDGAVEKIYALNEYTYDHAGRLIDTRQKTGDNISTTNPLIILTRNNYNQIGQLISKQIHSTNGGTSFAQTVKYKYNARGWVTSQSAPLFAQELKYELDSAGLTPQYNGNISMQKWGLNTALNKQYTYSYDKINRLTKAISHDNNNEQIGYNAMGNITRLQRHSASVLIDQLRYNYTTGNRLASVVDSNANADINFQIPGTTTYTYNSNGSMIERLNTTVAANNLTAMSYNHLDLPTSINANGALITYTYDALGNKLKKVVTGSATVNNDYISGILYEGNVRSISTGIGEVVRYSATNYSYEYVLTDHLGSRRVYFDINAGAARKIQETDYYAFGMGIQRSLIGTENKYQFTSREKQDQEKMYDHGARFYDPVIGRWNVADPLAEMDPMSSPYTYVYNNPAGFVDPDGMLGQDWVNGPNGPYWDENVTGADDPDLGGREYLGKTGYGIDPGTGMGIYYNGDGSITPVTQSLGEVTITASGVSKTDWVGGIQTGLDVVGLVPGFGEIADGLNALGYLAQGDYLNAGLSAAAMIPIAGWGATGGKLGIKIAEKGGAQIGRKLNYVFGMSTGSAHNIERSKGMLRQLQSVGIFDNAVGRSLMNSHLGEVYNTSKGILQTNGRHLRESLLMGPNGGLKVESIWEGKKLITLKLLGGK